MIIMVSTTPTQPSALAGNNLEVEYLSNQYSDLIQIWMVGLGDQPKANVLN